MPPKSATRKRAVIDISEPESPPPKISKASTVEKDLMSTVKAPVFPEEGGLKFLTRFQPQWDLERVYGPELKGAPLEKIQEESKKYMHKPLEDLPDWPWVYCEQAYHIEDKHSVEALKRDQDSAGMYIFNDWTGYGLHEVMENQLIDIYREFKKKKPSVYKLYAHLEAYVSWFLQEDRFEALHIDDGDRVGNILGLLSVTIVAVLHSLHTADMLAPDSELKSLPVVISMLLVWHSSFDAATFFRDDDARQCSHRVLAYVDYHGLAAGPAHNIDKLAAKLSKHKACKDARSNLDKPAFSKDVKDPWGFVKKYDRFVSRFGVEGPRSSSGKTNIGGSHYDIFKMSKAERKEKSFDNTDPLEYIRIER